MTFRFYTRSEEVFARASIAMDAETNDFNEPVKDAKGDWIACGRVISINPTQSSSPWIWEIEVTGAKP